MVIGSWFGARESLEPIYIETLKFDDYLLADLPRAVAAAGQRLRGLVRLAARGALRAFAQHLPAGRRLADEELHAGRSAGRAGGRTAAAGQPRAHRATAGSGSWCTTGSSSAAA